jgi:hypothetical protein
MSISGSSRSSVIGVEAVALWVIVNPAREPVFVISMSRSWVYWPLFR